MPTLGLEAIYATYRETYIAAIYSVVTRVLLFICVTLPVLFWGIGYKNAVLGFVISSFLSFLLALYLKNRPFRNVSKQQTSISVTDILKFCMPLMGAGIFNILINSTDQFFISRFFGTESFAEFSMVQWNYLLLGWLLELVVQFCYQFIQRLAKMASCLIVM